MVWNWQICLIKNWKSQRYTLTQTHRGAVLVSTGVFFFELEGTGEGTHQYRSKLHTKLKIKHNTDGFEEFDELYCIQLIEHWLDCSIVVEFLLLCIGKITFLSLFVLVSVTKKWLMRMMHTLIIKEHELFSAQNCFKSQINRNYF